MSEEEQVFTDDDKAIIEQLEQEDAQERETNTKVTDDNDSGSQVAAATETSDEDGIGDELRERATQYGLDPEAFESREHLERQISHIDLQWANHVRQQRAAQQQPAQQQKQQVTEQQPPELPFKLELDPNEYPQEMIDALNGALKQVHDYYSPLRQTVEQLQGFVAYQQQQVMQQNIQREQEMFMEAVESLGHKQLFGDGTPNTTQQQAQNLVRLYQEAEVLADSYRMRGIKVPSVKELVKRAEQMAFSDHLQQYQQQTRNARLAKQANQKLGTGRRANEAFSNQGEWDGEPEDDPRLIKAWNEMIAAQGER